MTDEEEPTFTVTFQLKGDEIIDFKKMFLASGFRNKSEYIRFLIKEESKRKGP